jgi:hypothetical protein
MEKKIYLKYFILSLAIFFFSSLSAYASTNITLSPNNEDIAVNSTFSIDILVSNNQQAINAVSGVLKYPIDILKVQSLSQNGSIIKMWSYEPANSSAKGEISFEGIIFNPGYSNMSGKVLTVTFVSLKKGPVDLHFNSGSVLANDGQGTNVLKDLGTANFSILEDSSIVATTELSSPPSAPKIISTTYFDPSKWLNKTQPTFVWNVPSDVTAVRLLYDQSPTSVPVKVYEPAILSKTLDTLTDGTYYFHAQFRNKNGWGSIAHYKFKVDTKPPQAFTITFPHGDNSTDPQPIVLFNTTDDVAGIDHYEIKIGDGELLKYAPEALSNPYAVPVQQPGKHTIVVKAIDKAGNETVQSAEFVVQSIASPVLTIYPNEIEVGDTLKIRGTSYPDATITLYLKDKKGQIQTEFTKSNSLGDFALVWPKRIEAGTYQVTLDVLDSRGARSQMTDPLALTVHEKVLFYIAAWGVTITMFALMIVVVMVSLVLLTYFIFTHLVLIRRRLKKNMMEVQKNLQNDLASLKDDIKTEIHLLDETGNKKSLNNQEKMVIKNLHQKIDAIEESVTRKCASIMKNIR